MWGLEYPRHDGEVAVDLHAYHPHDLTEDVLRDPIKQAWEMGAPYVRFIHGHGKARATWTPQFLNTNTGYLGVTVRHLLRGVAPSMKPYMYVTGIDVSHDGSTAVRLKANPAPSRARGRLVLPKIGELGLGEGQEER